VDLKPIIQRAEKQTVKQGAARVVRENLYSTVGSAFRSGSLVDFLARGK
jgi:hypothetical protein